jgi:hypothetical protein
MSVCAIPVELTVEASSSVPITVAMDISSTKKLCDRMVAAAETGLYLAAVFTRKCRQNLIFLLAI